MLRLLISLSFFFEKKTKKVAPQIRISFGANIQTDSIREGSDVYMECQVKANPQVKEVVWIHDGRPIHSFMATGNVEDSEKGVDSDLNQYQSVLNQRYRYDHHYQQQQGPNHHGSTIIMTNQSLVIQKVHRSHRGRYQCVALNDQGETISDPLYLQVDCELILSCYIGILLLIEFNL